MKNVRLWWRRVIGSEKKTKAYHCYEPEGNCDCCGFYFATSAEEAKKMYARDADCDLSDIKVERIPKFDSFKSEKEITDLDYYEREYYVECPVCGKMYLKSEVDAGEYPAPVLREDNKRFYCMKCAEDAGIKFVEL